MGYNENILYLDCHIGQFRVKIRRSTIITKCDIGKLLTSDKTLEYGKAQSIILLVWTVRNPFQLHISSFQSHISAYPQKIHKSAVKPFATAWLLLYHAIVLW